MAYNEDVLHRSVYCNGPDECILLSTMSVVSRMRIASERFQTNAMCPRAIAHPIAYRRQRCNDRNNLNAPKLAAMYSGQ